MLIFLIGAGFAELYPLHDGAAFCPQPAAGGIIIGAIGRDQRPKTGRVVHLTAVAQLVDHHIVTHPFGAEHKEAVEIQIPLT